MSNKLSWSSNANCFVFEITNMDMLYLEYTMRFYYQAISTSLFNTTDINIRISE